MLRMPRWRLCCVLIFLGSIVSAPGCSEDSAGPIDTRVVIEKATGGQDKSKLSGKAKAADEEAAKLHPKLH
jgi:hypothetical protein